MTPTHADRPDALATSKAELRRRARDARRAIDADARARAHAAITERVLAIPEIRVAGGVLLYGTAPDEVDVGGIARAVRARGGRTFLPRVAGEDLEVVEVGDDTPLAPGFRGILEPIGDPADVGVLDAVVVPGLAFDAAGRRVGQGKGYYDRLLPRITGVRVAVAYDEQVVDVVPAAEHDAHMDALVTPTRTIRFAR
jgi:5-formyltetrahydrofolate cyclo-ligase